MENQTVSTKPYFLMVDDELLIRRLFRDLFEIAFPEYTVVFPDTFAEAEVFIRENIRQTAVVMLDGKLDGGRFGYELAEQIRASGSQIPVILLTGTPDRVTIPDGKKHLFNLIWEKPISPKEVAGRIKKLISA